MFKLFLWIVRHEFFCRMELIGMRERLRCPYCRSIGTWKPYEGPRRWLCKCCGRYDDGFRIAWAQPCGIKGVWMLKPIKPTALPWVIFNGQQNPWSE